MDLGELSTQLFELKSEKTALNEKIKDLNGVIKTLEISILEEMKNQKVIKFSDDTGTVFITTQVFPKVVNWDLFYKHIQVNGYFHMLERRPSASAFREANDSGLSIPGVEPNVFDEIRTRKS